MHALSKLVTLGVVVAFASAVAVTVSAKTGSEIGTWKMNVAKSLAGNSRTSKRILKDLLKDEDSRVRASAQQSLA